MDTDRQLRAHISSFHDNAHSPTDREIAIAAIQSPEGQAALFTYRVIAQVLKSDRCPGLSDQFAARLATRLEQEPPPLRVRRLPMTRRPLPLQYSSVDELITLLQSDTSADMDAVADALLAELAALPRQIAGDHVVPVAIRVRDALAVAKGKGLLMHPRYGEAMKICAASWKRLFPAIADTGLAAQERAVIARYRSARSSLGLRAAMEDAGTVAWLYEASAVLGMDLSDSLAPNIFTVPGTRYRACYDSNVLRYLQCGASYNVNHYLRIALPDDLAPALVIAGEAKGGDGAYGIVRGARSFMVAQGVGSGIISQADRLYPLSRAMYMARANSASLAGRERKMAGKAIEQAGMDGMLLYMAARGRIDMSLHAISSETEVFLC